MYSIHRVKYIKFLCTLLLLQFFFFFFQKEGKIFAQERIHSIKFSGNSLVTFTNGFDAIGNRTVMFWLKPNSYPTTTSYVGLFSIYDTKASASERVLMSGSGEINGTGSYCKIDEWTHIAIVTEPTTIRKTYINGILVNTQTSSKSVTTNGIMRLGADFWNYGYYGYFNGEITDLRIYNKALSQVEISDLQYKLPETENPNLIHYWKCNETNGEKIIDKGSSSLKKDGSFVNITRMEAEPVLGTDAYFFKTYGESKAIGEEHCNLTLKFSYLEYGTKGTITAIMYGHKDSLPISSNEYFPANISARSHAIWLIKKSGIVKADFSFDCSNIAGNSDFSTYKLLRRNNQQDSTWEEVVDVNYNIDNKTITVNSQATFGEYAIGMNLSENYLYTTYPIFNKQNIDSSSIRLQWAAKGFTSFDVLLGTDSSRLEVYKSDISSFRLALRGLKENTTYYWQIVGKNGNSLKTSNISKFTTADYTNSLISNYPNCSQITIRYNDSTGVYKLQTYTVVPDMYKNIAQANTGLAYDSKHRVFYIGEYRQLSESNIVTIDRHNNFIQRQQLPKDVGGVQGVAYDEKNEQFYVWAVKYGVQTITEDINNPGWTNDVLVFVFDKSMNLLQTHPTPLKQKSPGALHFEQKTNTLWMIRGGGLVATQFSVPDWKIIREVTFAYSGEGFAHSPFDQTFWIHDGTYIYHFAPNGAFIEKFPSPVEYQQQEGVVVDPSDNTIWLSADEYYHGGIKGGNRIWQVDPLKTYNKDALFPGMYLWEDGVILENLQTVGDTLYLKKGAFEGSWLSPILDFKTFTPQYPKYKDTNGKTEYHFLFRGSDIAPSISPNSDFELPYYKVNQINDGWGTTVPTEWQTSIPETRYVQFKLVLELKNEAPLAYTDAYNILEDSKLIVSGKENILSNDFDFDAYPVALTAIINKLPKFGKIELKSNGDFTYTPNKDFFGKDTLWYQTFDGKEYSAATPVIFSIANVNDAPIIVNQATQLSFNEDNSFTITLNDLIVEDIDSPFPDNFSIQCQNGVNYSISGNNIIPKQDFYGTLSIPIVVDDGSLVNSSSDIFYLKVNILPVNDAPIIVKTKVLSIEEDNKITISLTDVTVSDLDNTFPDDFTLELLSGDNYLVENNTIIPEKNFNGNLLVPVYADDGQSVNGKSNVDTITIKIIPVNDAPAIVGQNALETLEDNNISLTINDLVISDVDNFSLSDFHLILYSGENYVVNNNQIIPNENFFGTLTIPVQVFDKGPTDSLSNIYNLILSIKPVNDTPTIQFLPEVTYNEDEYIEYSNMYQYIKDVETKSIFLHISWINGKNVKVNYSNYRATFSSINQNWFGTDSVYMVVSDGESVDTMKVNVICKPINDSPVVYQVDTILAQEDDAFEIPLSSIHFTDVDFSSNEKYSIQLIDNKNYIISNNKVYPIKDFYGQMSVLARISDNESINNMSDTIRLPINVLPINDCPVLNITDSIVFEEDNNVVVDFSKYCSDVDNSIDELSIDAIESEHIKLEKNGKIIRFSSKQQDWNGAEEIMFKLNDGNNNATQILKIKCTPVNDIFVLNFPEKFSIKENQNTFLRLSDKIKDIDNSLDEIEVNVEENQYISIKRFNKDSIQVFNKQDDWYGIRNIIFTFFDGLNFVRQNVEIKVIPENDCPEFLDNAHISIFEDSTVLRNIFDVIYDPDSDQLQLTIQPPLNTVIKKTNDSTFYSFTPRISHWHGLDSVLVSVADTYCVVNKYIPINCLHVNHKPKLFIPENIFYTEDSVVKINFRNFITDIDDSLNLIDLNYDLNDENNQDKLTLYWDGNQNISVNPVGNTILFSSSSKDWNGSENITFYLRNGNFTISQLVTITCLPLNDPPQLLFPKLFYFVWDSSVQLDISKYIFDIDNNTYDLSFTIKNTEPFNYEYSNTLLNFEFSSKWLGESLIKIYLSDNEYTISDSTCFISYLEGSIPLFSIPDSLEFKEDETLQINLLDYFTSTNIPSENFSFKVYSGRNIITNTDSYKLVLRNNYENWNGVDTIYLEMTDFYNNRFIKQIIVKVKPVNDAPVFLKKTPLQDMVIRIDSLPVFRVNAYDIDNELTYKWFLNGIPLSGMNDSVKIKFQKCGINILTCEYSDGYFTNSSTWGITVFLPDSWDKGKVNGNENYIYQNYPNPFDNKTIISYYLVNSDRVSLYVYALNGDLVKVLLNNEYQENGFYSIIWNGSDNNGGKLSSGVYFYKIITSNYNEIKKAIYITK